MSYKIWKHKKNVRKPPTENRPKIIHECKDKDTAEEYVKQDIEDTIEKLNTSTKNPDITVTYEADLHPDTPQNPNPFGFSEWEQNSPIASVMYIRNEKGHVTYIYCVEQP